jgi:DNA modification methylase
MRVANDDLADAAFLEFMRRAFAAIATAMKPGAAIYVAHADTEGLSFRKAFADAGLKLSGVLIWRKDSLVLGRSDYQWQHEPILYGWKTGKAHRWYGGRKQTTLAELGGGPFAPLPDGRWQISVGDRVLIVSADAVVEELVPSVFNEQRPRRSDDHPTMKPIGLIERQLRNNTRPGDLVLDAFAGSGSTLIAADRLGLSCALVEIDPCYSDVAVRRWQEFSGLKATRESDGAKFDDLEPAKVMRAA